MKSSDAEEHAHLIKTSNACKTTLDLAVKPLLNHPEQLALLHTRLAMCIATLNTIKFQPFTHKQNLEIIETTLVMICSEVDDEGGPTYGNEGELREAGILPDRRCPEDYVGE
jgi:hypothetical protein